MTASKLVRYRLWIVAIALACARIGTASAAALQPGEYMCVGSGGSVLIGLGFILRADGSYTDLDGKSAGRINFNGANGTFVGGHLDGEVARNIKGNSFQIHSASCSRNR